MKHGKYLYLPIMWATVKQLEITYRQINKNNTFSNGDIIAGQVTLEVARNCQIKSLFIKFKGKAQVKYMRDYGQLSVQYQSKDKYFSVRQYLIPDKNIKDDEGRHLTTESSQTYRNIVRPGRHIYPFIIQLPSQDIPSSFKGGAGEIVYLLEATLCRPMRINKKTLTKIAFVSKMDLNSVPWLLMPQRDSKEKKMHVFTSGSVTMDVSLEKMVFIQGEGIKVMALIKNDSSREIKLKYSLQRNDSFFAQGDKKIQMQVLTKEVGDCIPPSAQVNVTKVITIPDGMEPSIHNCRIIRVEHMLKVYLDVKFASDPEIIFPIVILPALESTAAVSPHPAAEGFGSESSRNMTPPHCPTITATSSNPISTDSSCTLL
ncbi:arrestin domain-containing protein 3-like [Pholidichthys leucotaenia]